MNIKVTHHIHRIKYDRKKATPRLARETRATQGARFKVLLLDAGLNPDTAGKLLHVTPRTIRYWISGKVTVPYAAFRLLRVMRLFELPCPGWEGWHMHSGRLWSPEGYGFSPGDSDWWGLLVRKAALFRPLYDRANQLDVAMQRQNEGHGDALTSTAGPAQAGHAGDGCALPDRRSRAHGEAVGLVPYKTKLEIQQSATSKRHQNDVIMKSWPTHLDFQTPSTLPPEHGPTTSVLASTPSFASPWTPSYGLRLNLLPPDQSQLVGPWSHQKQNSKNLPCSQRPSPPGSPERKNRPCTKQKKEPDRNSLSLGNASAAAAAKSSTGGQP